MFAARFQHWQQVIQPALAQQKVVVSDRFVDATYAYQGGGGQIAQLKLINCCWQPNIMPGLTLLLVLDVASA